MICCGQQSDIHSQYQSQVTTTSLLYTHYTPTMTHPSISVPVYQYPSSFIFTGDFHKTFHKIFSRNGRNKNKTSLKSSFCVFFLKSCMECVIVDACVSLVVEWILDGVWVAWESASGVLMAMTSHTYHTYNDCNYKAVPRDMAS